MKSELIVVASTSLLLLCGCGLATYNGWAVSGAKEKAIAAEADCTLKASNGAFKTGSEWAECFVGIGQQFASTISLNRLDLLNAYERNIRQIGADFDGQKINGLQFRANGKAAFDNFFHTIQRVELAHQQPDYNGVMAGMGALALGAAQANARAQQQPVQPSLMSVTPRPQNAAQTQTPQVSPLVRSPFIGDSTSYNCTSLLTGALINTQCQPR